MLERRYFQDAHSDMIEGKPIDKAHRLKLQKKLESLSLVEAVELANLELVQKHRRMVVIEQL